MKRSFDIVVALLGLCIFSPLLLLLSIWIKTDSRGPVFYRGERVGKDGITFKIFKFRSMILNADKTGVSSTSLLDDRITSSGHFIRKWKIDEISQLINVLKGDMSLVGPRPEVKEFVELYSVEERKLLTLRPGITDWASIWNSDEGGVLEGAVDADGVYLEVIRPIKISLQQMYMETRTFWQDIRIIYYTIIKIVLKSTIPKELAGYPDFDKLRERALVVIQEQKAS